MAPPYPLIFALLRRNVSCGGVGRKTDSIVLAMGSNHLLPFALCPMPLARVATATRRNEICREVCAASTDRDAVVDSVGLGSAVITTSAVKAQPGENCLWRGPIATRHSPPKGLGDGDLLGMSGEILALRGSYALWVRLVPGAVVGQVALSMLGAKGSVVRRSLLNCSSAIRGVLLRRAGLTPRAQTIPAQLVLRVLRVRLVLPALATRLLSHRRSRFAGRRSSPYPSRSRRQTGDQTPG